MNMLNLNLLRIFHTVARLRSFTRAAEALFLTQPGETLFPTIDRIFHLLDRSEKEIDDLKGMKSGDLRLGASVTIGIYFLPGILREFQRLHPGIRVSLDIDLNRQIVEKILDNAVDIGLLGAPETDERLAVTPFFKDELVVLTNTIEFGHTEAVKKAVEAGLGVSILSRSTIVNEEKLGSIRSISLSEVDLCRNFYFACRKDKYLTRLVRTFLQFIVYKSGDA